MTSARKTLLLATAAGAALAVASPFAVALIALAPAPAAPERFADPFDPLALANTACGAGIGPWGSRRAAFVAAAAAYAAEGDAATTARAETQPLWTGLGPSTMQITTSSEAAAIYFE